MNLGFLPRRKSSSRPVRTPAAALTLVTVFAIAIIATPAAQAQTYKVLYSFTGGADGSQPQAGLTIDMAGNLYGTARGGGSDGYGAVFGLKNGGSDWAFSTLYSFRGGSDGATPAGRVALVADGTLYGTTNQGFNGGGNGCGTVFHLRPSATAPKSAPAPWNETVIYRFTCGSDGGNPQGDLTFDQLGDIYGTTWNEGGSGDGTVYELSPSANGWTVTTLYSSVNGHGVYAYGGVVFDKSGSLYGVFYSDSIFGVGYGVVYQLLPSRTGSWKEHTLHQFTGGSDGGFPVGGLIVDSFGNLYGTTTDYGSGGGGTVFELTPANSAWIFNVLYSFSPGSGDGDNPEDKLAMDAAGNLYGTAANEGLYGFGSVFKLTPSDGGWTYTSLHDFTGSDGGTPVSNVIFDANGNLYGTTLSGGSYGWGVVWQITP